MPKHTMTFNLPDESDELKNAMAGEVYLRALVEISDDVFRPHRKHGYSDPVLKKLCESEDVIKAIGLLEQEFHRILQEYGVNW